MTKEAICKTLEEIITRYGFTYTYSSFSTLPMVDQSSNDCAGILFREHMDLDIEARTCTTSIIAEARVCRMGGSDSYDELLAAADQITRAAELMREVNALGLSHTIHYGE